MSEAMIAPMGGAYFAGRSGLLNWLNDILELNYTDLKQAANGAAFCQVIDAIYPGKVPMQRVSFSATLPYEYEKNYKILQESFTKLGISKGIEVEKLSKGAMKDVLEFCQWLKQYYYQTLGDRRQAGYDPKARRAHAIGGGVSDHPGTANSRRKAPASMPPSAAGGARSPQRPVKSAGMSAKPPSGSGSRTPASAAAGAEHAHVLELQKKLDEVVADREELRSESENIERERDFYFEKLRQIETLCQPHQEEPLIKEIMQILYAAEGEFQPAEEDEEGEGQAN